MEVDTSDSVSIAYFYADNGTASIKRTRFGHMRQTYVTAGQKKETFVSVTRKKIQPRKPYLPYSTYIQITE